MTIGLTYTGNEIKHENYVRWLQGNDQHLHIKKLDVTENVVDDLDDCDALVLSGGIDVHPKYYGGKTPYDNQPTNEWDDARDEFEIQLYKQARIRKIPVLGICRGMQLINCLEGGTLIQDLGTFNSTHRFDQKDKLHSIAIEKDSLLHSIITNENAEVNSAHHQAINKIAGNLIANSRAGDGTIEGLEWKDKTNKPFLLCVQWHPERMSDLTNAASKNIRDRFLAEIKQTVHSIKDH